MIIVFTAVYIQKKSHDFACSFYLWRVNIEKIDNILPFFNKILRLSAL